MNRNGGRHSEPSPTIASAITRGAISLNGCLSGYSQSLETPWGPPDLVVDDLWRTSFCLRGFLYQETAETAESELSQAA
jgi:hypothetical protein